ncbi:hypothetical protein [Microbulbifer sp. JMSA003]|uniref:hypothetical protein n=1 Tax=Microbulbifer sp. JMSA003 TaxID=3243369 RepID=UPI00403968DD
MYKNLLISVLFIFAVIGSGSYGYHLADERVAKFIQKNAVDNAVFHYLKLTGIIEAIEQGNEEFAIRELEALKSSEAVLFDSCLNSDCPKRLRSKIESAVKP